MNRIYIYHPYRATGLGGIESLIRSFSLSEELAKISFTHIYNHIPSTSIFDAKEFKRNDFDEIHIRLPEKLKGKILTFIRVYLFYKFILSDSRPGDSIIVFHPTDMAFFSKDKLAGRNLILVQTNPFHKLLETYFSKLTMRRVISFITVVTVYTQKDKERFFQHYPDYAGDILIIPRGCRLKARIEPPDYSFRLVTIARIDEGQKDFNSMLEILKDLPKEYTLDIYGDGDHLEVESLKKRIHSIPRARFMGVAKDVSFTLRSYSVFLMTSRYEGFGQTLIEARSQGLPLVAYNTFDALSWIVHHGVNGFCIPPGNSSDFTEAILRITKNENDYLKYAGCSLKLATETDENRILSLWASIFKKYTRLN